MARWHEDDVDCACQSWAYQWVQAFGKDPDRASRFVGPLGCTLGRVRGLHDGAASNTDRDRHFPEVCLGQGLIVAIALKCMSLTSQEIIGYHYIARCYDPTTWSAFKRPMKQGLVAERMGISRAEYYQRRDTAKACIRTALSLDTKALASARLSVVESDQMQELPLHP